MTDPYPIHEALNPIKDQMHLWWEPSTYNGYPCVPSLHQEAIANFLANVVAELIESYLDAGSEREAIHEEIYPHLLNEVKGWTEAA